MFEALTDKLGQALRNLRGVGRLTEENMAETLQEVRTALLSADVHFKVAREFVERVGFQPSREIGLDRDVSLHPNLRDLGLDVNDPRVQPHVLGVELGNLTLVQVGPDAGEEAEGNEGRQGPAMVFLGPLHDFRALLGGQGRGRSAPMAYGPVMRHSVDWVHGDPVFDLEAVFEK